MPPPSSPSPVPKQEQWTRTETTSAPPNKEEIDFMINDALEESVFEDLKGLIGLLQNRCVDFP